MPSDNILVFEKVDSTNNYAMGMIKKNEMPDGGGILALEQTAGKGRRGKHWVSEAGQNVMLSVAVQMSWQPLFHQFQVSVASALACHDVLAPLINEKVKLKWPNDIYIHDSKAGGVLIENVVKGTIWQWAVIGVGINVNQGKFDRVERAVSLQGITGKNYNIRHLAANLRKAILCRVNALKEGGFAAMLAEYLKHLYAKDQKVKLKQENRIFETTIVSVTASGELVTKDIWERQFRFDEVSFLGLA